MLSLSVAIALALRSRYSKQNAFSRLILSGCLLTSGLPSAATPCLTPSTKRARSPRRERRAIPLRWRAAGIAIPLVRRGRFILVDLRDMPREVQEQAFEEGLIPFIPADQK